MALDATQLFRVAQWGPGNSLFVYLTTDAIATVIVANYFGPAAKDHNIKEHDLIVAIDTDATTVDLLVVSAVDQDAQTNTVVNGT